jgi:fibronectin-binding autotransporter adhesin
MKVTPALSINLKALAILSLLSLLTYPNASLAAPFGLWINPNSTNSYSDASKWVAIDGSLPGGVPGSGNDAYIFDGTLQVGTGGNFNPQQLIMGWESFHVGEFLQTGGTTRTEFWTTVGKAGNQVFNMSGGSYSAADLAVGWTNLGTSAVGTGVVNLSGGTFESRAATFIGLEGATGTVNISGGIYNAMGNSFGSFRIADYGVGTGTLNLSGTGVVNASLYTAVGGNGNGTLNITGGIWNQVAGGIVVGDAADLSWTGRGDVNQSGGTVNADYVFLQKGTYNLNGGNLSTAGVADTRAETTGVFNFNGGMLWATGPNTNFVEADVVEIKANGALIHTREHEVWINKPMSGAGGLVKGGTGILKLTATNSYAGETRVVDGTLVISGSLVATNAPTYLVNGAGVTNANVQVTNGAIFSTAELNLGWEASDRGTFEQTGGNVNVVSWTRVGFAGNTTLNQSGGSFSTADLAVGWKNPAGTGAPTGVGVVNVSGGTFTSRLASFIGLEGGDGTLNITGGIYNATGNEWGSFRIANFGVGTGTLNLSGDGVVNASLYSEVGGEGNGTLNISGGTWNQISGGIVVGDHANPAWTGRGDVNQSGGTVNADYILLQQGAYNLNGGTLLVNGVADAATNATSAFNFNGGTLRALDNNADFIQANVVEIKAGGATIDTADKEVWIIKGMTGTGGLTKKGTGILKLAGVNSYGGSTTVQEGTLRIEATNFIADATPSTLTVAFSSAPADGQLAIFPGTLNGSPSVSFTGLAAGQMGVFSPLSGKATFTTTSTGVSFSSWSGGQTLTPELLGKYAIGGASGPSASSVRPVLTSTGGVMILSALVRTNSSASSFAVIGEYSTNLVSWLPLTNNPAGTPSASTNSVPEGFQRKDFIVPAGSSKMFLRLKSSL